MKTYVLTISERFPVTHKKSGLLTNFPLLIEEKTKIHTIRGNFPLWRKRFDEIEKGNACLSVRGWTGKPYHSKQEEFFRFDKSHGIGIEKLFFSGSLEYPLVDEFERINIEVLSKNDGLSLTDFKGWFKDYNTENPMAIIHFTSFRYSK